MQEKSAAHHPAPTARKNSITLNTTTTAAAASAPATPLIGSAGNDILHGSTGDDVLDGLAGKDTLNGGLGNDTYLFGRGDGRDIVYMSDVRPMNEVNTLRLKEGVLPSDIAFDMSGTSLLINILGSNDQFRADGFFYGNNTTNSANPLQQISFADGSSWNLAEIQARLYAGSEGGDRRDGTYLNDVIAGLGGNDMLDGKGGDDTIDGGDGDDIIIGGAGDDRLTGDVGNDIYLFGAGDGEDIIRASEEEIPGELNTLQFKAGIVPGDVVLRRTESDLVVTFKNSTGKITVNAFFSDYSDDLNNVLNPLQQLRFDDGTAWDRAAIRAWVIAAAEGNDTIDGSDNDDLINGYGGDDQLYGGQGNDTIDGGSGNDTSHGGSGDDTLLFGRGDGQDRINVYVGHGIEVLQFKQGVLPDDIVIAGSNYSYLTAKIKGGTAGADKMYGNSEANTLFGQEGDDFLSGGGENDMLDGGQGNDTLNGDDGNDTLDGGRGNDTLDGGSGSDTYLFGRGDGADIITLTFTWDDPATQLDALQLKPGIAPADVTLATPYSGTVLKIVGGTDQIRLDDYPNLALDRPLQEIRFSDGTVWNTAKMESVIFGGTNGADQTNGSFRAEAIWGLAGDDHLNGHDGDDMLIGGDGNDQLIGGFGNDTLVGGAGDDQIVGGNGNDTYLFGRGDGQDTLLIHDMSWPGMYNLSPDTISTLRFDAGISGSDLQLSASDFTLIIKIAGGSDQITVKDFAPAAWWYRERNPLQQITFADGVSWDLARIDAELKADTPPAPAPAAFASMVTPEADVGLVGVTPAPGM